MAVIMLSGFRTIPGRLAQHLAASAEAIEHLRRLDMQAVALQAISGGDIGTIATSINFQNYSDYATSMQRVLADEGWQEFWGRVTADPSAEQVESSLFSDLDFSFQPAADRPMGVVMATQWRPRSGRMMDFVGNVAASTSHIERLGGVARPLQSVIGAHPMTVMVAVTFADLDAFGEYNDRIATDDKFQEFWAGVMSDPTGDLIRSGVYLNISQ